MSEVDVGDPDAVVAAPSTDFVRFDGLFVCKPPQKLTLCVFSVVWLLHRCSALHRRSHNLTGVVRIFAILGKRQENAAAEN